MRRLDWVIRWLLASCCLFVLPACERSEDRGQSAPPSSAETPADLRRGETLFNAKCQPCHGPAATGTSQGPPLVSKIYEPNHHGDFSFHRAVQQGVRAHHWQFGDMPRIEGLTSEDVNAIIAYVRWLQRQAGIF